MPSTTMNRPVTPGAAGEMIAAGHRPSRRCAIAGRPQQTVEERNLGTFVFDGYYAVQVVCQYVGRREQIMTACQTVLDTLRLGV